jgi:hypothetical protein
MLRVSAVAFLTTAGVISAFAQCSTEIAVVVDSKGVWSDAAHKRILRKKDAICSDSVVMREATESSADDFLTLAVRSQLNFKLNFECKALLDCEKPLDLAPLREEEDRRLKGSSVLQSISVWWNSRSRNESTLSGRRWAAGDSSSVLRTVVVKQGQLIATSQAFRVGSPAGDYLLDFCLKSTDDECGKSLPAPKKFTLDQVRSGNLPFNADAQGLYLLYRVKDDDPHFRTTDRVLILVVAPLRFSMIPEAKDKIAIAELALPPAGASPETFHEGYIRYLAKRLTSR